MDVWVGWSPEGERKRRAHREVVGLSLKWAGAPEGLRCISALAGGHPRHDAMRMGMVDTPGAWRSLGRPWLLAVADESATQCQGSWSGLVLSSGNGNRDVPRWCVIIRGALHALVRREEVPEAVWPPTQDKVTTHGLHRVRSSVEPSAVSAFTSDPYRGWGRYCLAHIRAQRAPVDSPAGSGAEYHRP